MHITSTHDTDKRKPLLVAGLIGLIAVLWTVVEGLPVLMSAHYSLYQIVWMRYATHLVVMLVWLGPRRMIGLLRTSRPTLQIGRGLLMLAMPTAYITSIGRMVTHNVLAVFWICPLFILGFATTIGGEHIDWPVWIGTIVSVIGALFVTRPDLDTLRTGALLALVMGLSFSLYIVLTRALRHEPREANLLFTAACVVVPLSLVMPAVWKMPSLQDALIMAAVGLLGLGLLWVLDRVCELTPASTLAAFLPLQLVCDIALTDAWVGQGVGKLGLAGFALIGSVAIIGLVIGLGGQFRQPRSVSTAHGNH